MSKDASAILHSPSPGELERLSALETLKGLKSPKSVSIGDLVRYLNTRGLWPQFAKITLGDLREGFTEVPEALPGRKKKRRILEDVYEEAAAEAETGGAPAPVLPKAPSDGGLSTDDFVRQVMPFIEGNGEVTLDDIEDYIRLDRKVIRYHLGVLVKSDRLERIGVGRHAVYGSLD